MKLLYMAFLLSLLSCVGRKNIQTKPILAAPAHVSVKNAETGRIGYRSTYVPITPSLKPQIIMISRIDNELTLKLQGKIGSGGLSRRKVKGVRLEQGDLYGNDITLKYIVEIERVTGKENANVQGYNYTTKVVCKVPEGAQLINVELYEERPPQAPNTKPQLKLMTSELFDFFPIL
ncbi:hypothetical protein [Empedobacter sedimenti]|uniref:hypothetical protein n=1 Tax=Empedobacter sedimenti TaxID=3042610 RepID=UPI0024A69479|nr:hypothetical protein [Empedobacter sedimenti]